IKQSGGTIELQSDPGKGTTFCISLPCAEERNSISEAQTAPHQVPAGVETILVVEDDAAVRQLICTILQEAGYHVQTARDGAEALCLFDRNADEIAMVVTDLVMPEM